MKHAGLHNLRLTQLALIGTLMASPVKAQSIADAVNGKLPAWLQIGGLFRTRVEAFLDRGFTSGQNDVHLLNRFRLDINLRVLSWMKVVLEGQDSRIYFQERSEERRVGKEW